MPIFQPELQFSSVTQLTNMQRKESVTRMQENRSQQELIRVDSEVEFSRKELQNDSYKHPQRIKEKGKI